MITVRINDNARGSKKLIEHLHSLKFVEFEETDDRVDFNDEFDALEKQSITGDELVKIVCAHIDELFDAEELHI